MTSRPDQPEGAATRGDAAGNAGGDAGGDAGRGGPGSGSAFTIRGFGRGAVGWLLLALASVFVAVALVRNWHAVRRDLGSLAWTDVAASTAAATGAVLLTGLAWHVLLVGLGARAPLRPALALYCAGQLGKYVPGSVWVLAMQAEFGRRIGISRAVTALAYLVAILVALATGGLVGLLALVTDAAGSMRAWAPALAAVGLLVGLAVARPRAINAAIRWVAARSGRELPALDLPAGALARALLLTTAAWLLFGLHAWLLARPLGAGPGLLAPTVGAFALAFVAGLVLVPLPAGAGVREGVLVATLGASIGAPAALTVALVSRLVLVVVDVVLALALGVRGGVGPRRLGPDRHRLRP